MRHVRVERRARAVDELVERGRLARGHVQELERLVVEIDGNAVVSSVAPFVTPAGGGPLRSS